MNKQKEIIIQQELENLTDTELQELLINERKEYFKQYRAKNKDKIRDINAKYWLNRAIKRAVSIA